MAHALGLAVVETGVIGQRLAAPWPRAITSAALSPARNWSGALARLLTPATVLARGVEGSVGTMRLEAEVTAPRELDWLLRTMDGLLRCRTVAALLDLAYDAIRDGLGYDHVGLLLADHTRGTLVEQVGTDAQGRKFHPRQRIVPLGDDGYYSRLLALPAMQPGGPGYVYLANTVRELPAEVRDRLDGQPGQTLRVALRTADGVIGLISVDNLISGRPVCPEHAPPLVAFANSLATAVANARLLEENARRIEALDADLRHRVAQLTWLQQAAARLALLRDRDGVLDTIYACLRHHYDRVGLFLFEDDGAGRRVSREVRGTDEEGQLTHSLPDVHSFDDPDLALHSPDIHHLLQGHAYYYCPDRWAATPEDRRGGLVGRMREQLAVALRHEDALVGYLSVDNLLSGRPIVEADAPPLVTFASQAALAIDRAHLWAAHEARGRGLARRVRELEWLRDMSRGITAARTRGEVLDVVYAGVREGLGYDRVGITLFDHEAGVFEDCIGTDVRGRATRPMVRTVGLTPDSPLWRSPGIAALLRGAEYYHTADVDVDAHGPPELRDLGAGAPRHTLMAPLCAGSRVMGMIWVDNLLSGRPIAPEDAGPLLALANQVVTAIENARLLERERAERARLATLASTDALTGLPNRATLHERLAQALRAGAPVALLLLDLDRFKEVNDTLGHHIGDGLLSAVAARLVDVMRREDTVARLGGDEFAVVLPTVDAGGGSTVARAIRAAIEAPFVVEGQALSVGVSVGVAAFPEHGADAAMLLRHADVAMYAAKQSGLGYALYDPTRDGYDATRLGLVGDLRQAITAGAFAPARKS